MELARGMDTYVHPTLIHAGIKFDLLAWWRHQMETFSALLALCAGNSPVPVNSPHKGQWRGALMFTLICTRINDWVNNREAGDLRRHLDHYDVIVMVKGAPDLIATFVTVVRHTLLCHIDPCYCGIALCYISSRIAKTIGSTSIRCRFDAEVWDRYLIDGDPMVFAIWVFVVHRVGGWGSTFGKQESLLRQR